MGECYVPVQVLYDGSSIELVAVSLALCIS
jgi:hypothetical protein